MSAVLCALTLLGCVCTLRMAPIVLTRFATTHARLTHTRAQRYLRARSAVPQQALAIDTDRELAA